MRRALAPMLLAAIILCPGANAAAATPGAGGTPPSASLVRIPFPADDGTLTPYTFGIGYPLVTLVYDTLMWRNRDGVAEPWLARSVEADASGTALTLHLAGGVRWHDGLPLTSADVAFTFAYVAAHRHARFTPDLEQLAGVETPDADTVVLRLRRPSPGFLDQPLADVPILPQHLWAGLAADQAAPDGLPVGSGPYRMTAHRPGEGYRFEANDAYFRGRPAVAVIEVPIIPEAAGLDQALRRRTVDMIPVSAAGSRRRRPRGAGIASVEGPGYPGTVLVLNTRRPPFDRVEARRAVASALDLGRIAGLTGDAVAADHGYIHPASPWAATRVLQRFDPSAARRALAALNLPPLAVLARADDALQHEAGRQVALALQRAGAQANLMAASRDDLARALGTAGDPPDFQMAIASSPGEASDDPDQLRRLFGSGSEAAGLNPSGYSSPAFDAAAERVATAVPAGLRRTATGEALGILAGDLPVVPLLFAADVYAYRPAAFDGWVFVRGSGILDKLSFVEPRTGLRTGGGAGTVQSSRPDYTLGWVALALIAAALLLGAWQMLGRRRSG